MNRIPFLIDQLDLTRSYTLNLLSHTPRDRWPIMPAGAATHVSWQVGHLVMAQYAHFAKMIGTETNADRAAVDFDHYASLCGKGTNPSPDASIYPTPDRLLHDLEQTHALARRQLESISDETLDLPTHRPHQVARNRWEMALWWTRHEMLHLGQIALLRRLHGLDPWR
jgi:hypothetical protein